MEMFLDPLFRDRRQAGCLLAERLAGMDLKDAVIYALPRGGAPVAAEVAARLNAPLDVILARKIGAPGQPELALGAVVDGADPFMVINEDIRRQTGASDAFIEAARRTQLAEIDRRRALYALPGPRPDPRGRPAVLVDDGLATGATARAAIEAVRRRGAARILLAIPVAPPDVVEAMRRQAEVVVLAQPEPFWGVGRFYEDFRQIEDAEVVAILRTSAAKPPPG